MTTMRHRSSIIYKLEYNVFWKLIGSILYSRLNATRPCMVLFLLPSRFASFISSVTKKNSIKAERERERASLLIALLQSMYRIVLHLFIFRYCGVRKKRIIMHRELSAHILATDMAAATIFGPQSAKHRLRRYITSFCTACLAWRCRGTCFGWTQSRVLRVS